MNKHVQLLNPLVVYHVSVYLSCLRVALHGSYRSNILFILYTQTHYVHNPFQLAMYYGSGCKAKCLTLWVFSLVDLAGLHQVRACFVFHVQFHLYVCCKTERISGICGKNSSQSRKWQLTWSLASGLWL